MIKAPEKGEPIDELWRPVAELVEHFKAFDNLVVKGTGFSGRLHVAPNQYVLEIQGGKRPAPNITNISPSSGSAAGGTEVTITGENFVDGVTVDVGLAYIGAATFDSSTQIRFITPPGSAAGATGVGPANVIVQNPDGQTAVVVYTYLQFEVTSVSPDHGPTAGGQSVHVYGTGFIATPIEVRFQFAPINGTPGTTKLTDLVFVNDTELTGVTPFHQPGLVNVVVKNPDGSEGGGVGMYTYDADPFPAVFTLVGMPTGPRLGVQYVCHITCDPSYTGQIGVGFYDTPFVTVYAPGGGIVGAGQPPVGTPAGNFPRTLIANVSGGSIALNITIHGPTGIDPDYAHGGFAIGTIDLDVYNPSTGAISELHGGAEGITSFYRISVS